MERQSYSSVSLAERLRRSSRARPGIGTKFGLTVMGATALVLSVACWMIIRDISAKDAAQAEITARTTANSVTDSVQRVFAEAFAVVDHTHDDIVELRTSGVVDPTVYDALVRRMVTDGNRYGAWLSWDGPTAPGDSAGGRQDAHAGFTSYVHQNGMEIVREGIPEAIYDSDLYKVPRHEESAFLLEPHEIDAANGDPTLVTSIARPLMIDDHVSGVLAVDMKLDAISDTVASLDVPSGTVLAVVSEGGLVAAASDKSWLGKPIGLVSREFQDLFASRRSGDVEVGGAGTSSLQVGRAIRFGAVKNPLYLLIRVPQISHFTANTRERISLIVICGAALLAVLLVVSLTMHWLVTGPMKKLNRAVDDLGRGLFEIEVPGCSRQDEIGTMAKAIARLQDSRLLIARLQEENGEQAYQKLVEQDARTKALSTRFSQTIEAVAGSLKSVADTIGDQSHDLSSTVAGTVVSTPVSVDDIRHDKDRYEDGCALDDFANQEHRSDHQPHGDGPSFDEGRRSQHVRSRGLVDAAHQGRRRHRYDRRFDPVDRRAGQPHRSERDDRGCSGRGSRARVRCRSAGNQEPRGTIRQGDRSRRSAYRGHRDGSGRYRGTHWRDAGGIRPPQRNRSRGLGSTRLSDRDDRLAEELRRQRREKRRGRRRCDFHLDQPGW